MQNVKAKSRFTEYQKKQLVAQSMLPEADIPKILKQNNIDMKSLEKWIDQYEYDRLVTNLVKKYEKLEIAEEKARSLLIGEFNSNESSNSSDKNVAYPLCGDVEINKLQVSINKIHNLIILSTTILFLFIVFLFLK